jgi:hypothetical protein
MQNGKEGDYTGRKRAQKSSVIKATGIGAVIALLVLLVTPPGAALVSTFLLSELPISQVDNTDSWRFTIENHESIHGSWYNCPTLLEGLRMGLHYQACHGWGGVWHFVSGVWRPGQVPIRVTLCGEGDELRITWLE